MSTEDAKTYLATREVPRLFECLMTGLMFHRPNDHLQYLIDSLEKVKVKGQDAVTWNMFVDVHSAKRPLPPISPDNDKKAVSRRHSKEDARPATSTRTTPLPPISSDNLTNGSAIFIMGGPCSGKSAQANRLAVKHPGWVNVHLGELMRTEIHNKDAHDKWKAAKDLIVSGQLAPEDITFKLLHHQLKNNTQADGFIIHGFPRNMEQVHLFEKNIGRVDAVLLVDCGEEKLTNNANSRAKKNERLDETPSAFLKRMVVFKEQTLPVLKYYDDGGKLYIVDGDQEEETIHDKLSNLFEKLLNSIENGRIPTPPPGSRPSTGRWSRRSATPTAPPLSSPTPSRPASPAGSKFTLNLPTIAFIPPPEIKVKDEGRKSDLPTAPIIFLAGGPGSGKGTQCAKVTARYPDIIHLSMGDIIRKEISEKGTADDKWIMIMKLLKQGDMAPVDVTEELLIRFIQDQPDAQAYLVEGYPRDALQYEEFNRNIGGHAFTILLDCESQYLHDRLVLRGGSGNDRIDDNIPAIEKKLAFFARNTLPLLKSIEDEKKLIVIDGDRDEDEVFYDIVKCLDFSLYGLQLQEGKTSGEGDKAKYDDEEEDENRQMVEEEEFAAATFSTTGDNGGNPNFSILLDALDDPIVMIEMEAQEEFALEDEEGDKTVQESEVIEKDNVEIDEEQVDLLASPEDAFTKENGAKEEGEQTAEGEELTNEEIEQAFDEKKTTEEADHTKKDVEQFGEAEQTVDEVEQSVKEVEQTTDEAEQPVTEVEQTTDEVEQTIDDTEVSQSVKEDKDVESISHIADDNVNIKNDEENGSHEGDRAAGDNQEAGEDEPASAEKLADSEREGDADIAAEDDEK